jgi:hypothetical protein
MIIKVTVDENRWDSGLTVVWLWWNTDVFCVPTEQQTSSGTQMMCSLRWGSEVGLFSVSASVQGEILRVNTG